MPDFPPWVIEALARGSTVGFFLACVAVIQLWRALAERERARAAADAAHFATLQSMQPMIREMAAALQANTAIISQANASVERSIDRLNERLFAANAARKDGP